MQILQTFTTNGWSESFSPTQQTEAIEALESGKILYFPHLAFQVNPNEQRFLSASYTSAKAKNISYDCRNDEIRGLLGSTADRKQIKPLLARFAENSKILLNNVLPHYSSALEIARTSLRPVEISHRTAPSYRKDDKRLHVDAFPANPNQGRRIIRVFTNVNPDGTDRVWRVGESFAEVAQRFLPNISRPLPGSKQILQFLNITKSPRTEYDHYMLQIHDRMKADMRYQQQAKQMEVRFPPGSTWIVQTDLVSHAAMSGQHVLEQTFYLPVEAMFNAAQSPLKILEQLTGRQLI